MVVDNGSSKEEQKQLEFWKQKGLIDFLVLLPENTGTSFPRKLVHQQALKLGLSQYVLSDNDLLPCVGWLESLREALASNKKLGAVSLRLWHQFVLEGRNERGLTYTPVLGNVFKLVKTEAVSGFFEKENLPRYGDDGALGHYLKKNNWQSAFLNDKWCYNLEPTKENWGYTEEQIKQDERRNETYPKPPTYEPEDWESFKPKFLKEVKN